ncbi:hypothetical protein Osc7112_6908 (plasmid) [Oscillatoria nigro-viridis PCC 7112]|uniref:Uncharacterized protein n=2 Tax=Phormidium nigroviride TaxID=482564 RepID=K9VU39_9CYAN|nr:hypothetical protein Osc7112_6908 [Oscillatoria nigro-viridis PCC 7112]
MLSKTALISSLLLIFIILCYRLLNSNKFWAWFYFTSFQLEQDEVVKCSSLFRVLGFSEEAHLNLDSVIQRTYPDGQFKLSQSVTMPLSRYAIAELSQDIEWVNRQKSSVGAFVHVLVLKKKPNGEYDVIYTCRKFMG